MLYYPVWLIEVEEDLFLNSFTQLYQSARMMMPNWNTTYQSRWIEEKGDLTLQMIGFSRMHNHPFWLIEVEEDLFLTSFTQLYQSTRMMMPLRYCNHRNNPDQTQWIQEKWDLTLQMFRYNGMLHHPVWLIEVEEDLFLISFFQYTNQWEWCCRIETLITKLNGLKRSEIWHCKWFGNTECSITQFDWLK